MYESEREAFERLKAMAENDLMLKSDLESAFNAILTRYATRIYENRFLVGGVCEVILVSALRAVGISAEDIATQNDRYDIRIPGGHFSVKGHFSKGASDIRLINVLGESSMSGWDTGTIFVLAGIGIGYADPELLPNSTHRVSDAVVLRYRKLREFLSEQTQFLIACQIPYTLADVEQSELASRTVAREILKNTHKLKDFI
jgi:hypothetical protein